MQRLRRVQAHLAARITAAAGDAPSSAYRQNAAAVLAKVSAVKVVPVIVLENEEHAVPLVRTWHPTRPGMGDNEGAQSM